MIAAARAAALEVMLLRRTSSLSVIESGGVQLVVSRRLASSSKCPLQIAVDGELRYGGFQINSLVAEEIHGIESTREQRPSRPSMPACEATCDAGCS